MLAEWAFSNLLMFYNVNTIPSTLFYTFKLNIFFNSSYFKHNFDDFDFSGNLFFEKTDRPKPAACYAAAV